MQISTKVVIDIESGQIIRRESYNYRGPVALLKSSSDENAILAQQEGFFKTLQGVFAKQFENQSNILSSLNAAFQPILSAGPNSFGFSPAEEAALRTSATENVAGYYKSEATALRESMAARGGGNSFLPSGADAQLEETLASKAAGQIAQTQTAITEAGYAQGRENFNRAAAVLGNTAQMYNPLGFAGATDTSGAQAFGSANTINTENQAWKGQLVDVLKGAAQGAAAGASGGLTAAATKTPA